MVMAAVLRSSKVGFGVVDVARCEVPCGFRGTSVLISIVFASKKIEGCKLDKRCKLD